MINLPTADCWNVSVQARGEGIEASPKDDDLRTLIEGRSNSIFDPALAENRMGDPAGGCPAGDPVHEPRRQLIKELNNCLRPPIERVEVADRFTDRSRRDKVLQRWIVSGGDDARSDSLGRPTWSIRCHLDR